jgi:CysZ protein
MNSAVSEFVAGVGLLGRGLGLVLRRRRLFWLGALPPLIMSVLFTAVLVVLIVQLRWIADALTPFADDWSTGAAQAVRVLVGVAVLGGALLLMIVTFTALTLALGSPIYDRISESVDAELEPGLRGPEESMMTGVGRSVRQSLTLIGISAAVAPLLFLAGLVPVVGQLVVPVLSAVFGGWMLCLELVGSAFERRGLVRLADRRAAMRGRRARCLGLAVPTFLLLAVPFAGVVVFPTATAAGTLLARDLLAGARPGRVSAATPRS